MKIAIYNKHLSTMGGGEKYMGVIAEYLSKNHSVDILTIDNVDKTLLSQRLNLDLKEVNIKILKNYTEDEISNLTREYDYFINSTFMSRLKNQSKNSLLIIFFPNIIDPSLTIKKSSIRYKFLDKVFGNSIIARFARVVYHEFKLLVYLILSPLVLLRLIGKVNLSRDRLYNSYLRHQHYINENLYLSTYDKIVSISEFTQKWTKDMLGLDTEILYPPVDIKEFKIGVKENIIISVGRFFIDAHNKKQLEMIKMFKEMYDKDPAVKDYEYHLCGGVDLNNSVNLDYLNLCKKESEGYPIFIHENISFGDLKKLYAKSKLFWHASGFGEDENQDPVKFEHFGITTVESMSAGAIPIVIGKGGQPEIVKDGVNGYLWNTKDELIEKTLIVIKSNELNKFQTYNMRWIEKFSRISMYNKMHELTGL